MSDTVPIQQSLSAARGRPHTDDEAMVFTLGKSKQGGSQGTGQGSSSGGAIGTDTFRRWREVASKAFSGGDHTGPTELGEMTHDPEVLLVDDCRPSWPDPRSCPEPRATISLTKEVSSVVATGLLPPSQPANPAPKAAESGFGGAVWQALGGLTSQSEEPVAAQNTMAAEETTVVDTVIEEAYVAPARAVGGSGSWSMGGTGYVNASMGGMSGTSVGTASSGASVASSRAQLRAVSGNPSAVAAAPLAWSDDMEKVGAVRIGPKTVVGASHTASMNGPAAASPIAQGQVSAPAAARPAIPPQPPEPSLFWEDELRRRFGTNLKSALGKGTIIEGTFSFDSPVCIDGTLIGEVHSTSTLIVGPNATVHANVEVGSLIVLGSVVGPVAATDLVEIKNGGRLEGDMVTKRVAIEDGGFFLGYCAQRRIKAPAKAEVESEEEGIEVEE